MEAVRARKPKARQTRDLSPPPLPPRTRRLPPLLPPPVEEPNVSMTELERRLEDLPNIDDLPGPSAAGITNGRVETAEKSDDETAGKEKVEQTPSGNNVEEARRSVLLQAVSCFFYFLFTC